MSGFNPEEFRDNMVRMAHGRRHRHSGFGIVFGTLVVLSGILFLLRNLGLVYVDRIWRYWPVILVALGLSRLAAARSWHRILWNTMLAAVGVVLLLNNLHILSLNLWNILAPLFVIFWGLMILFRSARRRSAWKAGGGPDAAPYRRGTPDRLDEWAVFGGIRRRIDSQQFEGGEINSIFGGSEIDLRPAKVVKDEIVVEANAIFGGIEIHVPDSWAVTVSGHGFFGGWDDHMLQSAPEGTRPHVIIEGSAVFGGVTVKN